MSASGNCKNCASLESRRRMGWRNYFSMVNEYVDLSNRYREVVERLNSMTEQKEIILPNHFLEELVENMKQLECPVCFENMTKDTFSLTRCYHKMCKTCIEQVKNTTNKCPICRKSL